MKPPIRVAIIEDGIEATAFNPDSPRAPFRVLIEVRAPGNLISSNCGLGTDMCRWLVNEARKYVAL